VREEIIRFRFDFNKFSDVFIYLAKNVKTLDKLKAVKLIYLMDRLHLVRYGKIITGDEYIALPYGPIPSRSLDIINILQSPEDAEFDNIGLTKLRSKINIDFKAVHPTFCATIESDNYYLSEAELETINEIIHEYGEKTGGELIDISHKHEAWKRYEKLVDSGQFPKIDYEMFFEGNPDATIDALEYMLESQENRDIDFAINS